MKHYSRNSVLSPQLSVIMPVYNGEKYLAEAIESILAQTFTDFEFLIVDDGSTDRSVEIIKSYGNRDSRIRCFQHMENLGSPSSRNHGIAEARGEYIATMDCDDISLPQRFERQIAFMRANPDIGLLGTGVQAVDADLNPTYLFNLPRQHAHIALNLFIGFFFVHSSTLIRRQYLDAVGCYDTKYRHLDDLYLYFRLLADTQIRFANLREVLVLYRIHPLGKSRSLTAERRAVLRQPQLRSLKLLGGERPEATVERFERLRANEKLGWADRRAAKRDITRLVESMIAHSWVDADDRPLLIDAMNRHLEQASPRLWQQFCHWRRHHFPRLFPDTFQLSQ
ncbi:MAG: glycosyltransferase family 2 protein [Chloroflexi bacterium]|nr:glycosyltransferase family 2 protein [Chloroflexota bacterium]